MGPAMSANLERIISIIGAEATLRLCKSYGGISHYIPRTPLPAHPIRDLLGPDSWKRLCHYYGGTRLQIPRGERAYKRAAVIGLINENRLSVRQIAMTVGCTERWVSKMRGEVRRGEVVDLPLFDGLPGGEQ